jgi:hypothetical protein
MIKSGGIRDTVSMRVADLALQRSCRQTISTEVAGLRVPVVAEVADIAVIAGGRGT